LAASTVNLLRPGMGHATLWCATCSTEVTRSQPIDGSADTSRADVLAAYAPQHAWKRHMTLLTSAK
jgi:hypothetical protein